METKQVSEESKFLTWFLKEQENGKSYNLLLNIKIVRDPGSDRGEQIKKLLYKFMMRNPVSQFAGLNYSHIWSTCFNQNPGYYCTTTPFNDKTAVQGIKILLSNFVQQYKIHNENWSLLFLLSKPLDTKISNYSKIGM